MLIQEARDLLAGEVALTSWRIVADRIGVNHSTLREFVEGKVARPRAPFRAAVAAYIRTQEATESTRLATGTGGVPASATGEVIHPVGPPRVSAGLPYRVRVWLQGFLLEITKGGATDAEVEEARQLLTSPEVFVYFSGGAPKEFNEDDVLDGMEALGEVVRRTLRKRGRKL